MTRSRRKPPVLAEIPRPARSDSRPGALRGSELAACEAVLEVVGDVGSLLVTGDSGAKQAIASGVAAAAVAGGRRVALVECDFAVPRLAESLGLAEKPGLHEYLNWDAEAGEILQSLVLAGPRSKGAGSPLVCVVAGEPVADSQELVSSEGFGHAMAKLGGAYDLVVMDGPPLQEPESAAAAASRAGAALACVKAAQASGKPGKTLRRALKQLPVRTAGLVLCG